MEKVGKDGVITVEESKTMTTGFQAESCKPISLATVTPSLVMVGPPYFFARTTSRPRGPRVTVTASGELVDTAQDCLTGVAAKQSV